MATIGFGPYCVGLFTGSVPATHASIIQNAILHEDLGGCKPHGDCVFLSFMRDTAWPTLALSLRHDESSGFPLGIFIVLETDLLLVAAASVFLPTI